MAGMSVVITDIRRDDLDEAMRHFGGSTGAIFAVVAKRRAQWVSAERCSMGISSASH